MRRIGFLTGAGNQPIVTAFRDEMRLARANTPDGSTYAAELAKMDLELIATGALPFALLIRDANPSMPMVISTCPGMVSNGFAKTLQHPGGLYTGIDELAPGVTMKRLTLLKFAIAS